MMAKHILKPIFLVLIVLFFNNLSPAQKGATVEGRDLSLDVTEIVSQLLLAPKASFNEVKNSQVEINLPLPEGKKVAVKVVESSFTGADFQKKYPDIKTYAFQGAESSGIYGSLILSPFGLRASIFTPNGLAMLMPDDHLKSTTKYKLTYDEGLPVSTEGEVASICDMEDLKQELEEQLPGEEKKKEIDFGLKNLEPVFSNGDIKRTFSIAIVATQEFFEANNDGLSGAAGIANAMTVITNTMATVNMIYNKELAIDLIYAGTPVIYQDNAGVFIPNSTISQHQSNPNRPLKDRTRQAARAVKMNFPSSGSYDIGHVFHNHDNEPDRIRMGGQLVDNPSDDDWSVGGVARVGSVCSNTPADVTATSTALTKGRGWSGWFTNSNVQWIKVVAHEIGHQFGANHTFNSTEEACAGGISQFKDSQYEIGSGSTLMSYQAQCNPDNISSLQESDFYFHTHSLQEIVNKITSDGVTCEVPSSNENAPPIINADRCEGGTYTLPKGTPFKLTGSGTDPDGDPLTFNWEQYDEDGAEVSSTFGFIGNQAATSQKAPLFRSYPPSASTSRTIPALNHILNDENEATFEALPLVKRNINMRLTGRDGRGGVSTDQIKLTVPLNMGPFEVDDIAWIESLFTISWDPAGTNQDNYCENVEISLSIDGGYTFPYVLTSNDPDATNYAPNTGSFSRNLPNEDIDLPFPFPFATDNARIKVTCKVDECFEFFDISDPFSIGSSCGAPLNRISPTEALSFQANDPALNLSLSNAGVVPVTSRTINITSNDPTMDIVEWDFDYTGPICSTPNNPIHYKEFRFKVDQTGFYNISFGAGTTEFIHLYKEQFNSDAPCDPNTSTFVSSSSLDAVINGNTGSTAGFYELRNSPMLEANTEYILVLTAGALALTSGDKEIDIEFSGPGNVLSDFSLPTNFAYTYIAVSTINGQVIEINSESDFTNLPGGQTYNIYGLSYGDESLPSDFENKTINQIIAEFCATPSTNFVPLSICPASDALVITEIMNNPSAGGDQDNLKEWFELYNTTNNPINLRGLEIDDGDLEQFTINSDVIIAPNQYITLGRSNVSVPFELDYEYGSAFTLSNTDAIIITCGGTEIDRVSYGDDFPNVNGESMNFNQTSLENGEDNNTGSNWCPSTTSIIDDPDFGTPGSGNIVCPSELPPSLAIATNPPSSRMEGNSGATDFEFTITRSGEVAGITTEVLYNVSSPGNSASEDDFEGGEFPSGQVIFAPGDVQKEIVIKVNGDISFEPNEAFQVTISAPNNDATLITEIASAIILNDDMMLAPCPASGELVITEIMKDPIAVSDGFGEWIEIYNPTANDFNLQGLVISDNNASHTVASSLPIVAGGYIIVARNGDATLNGGVAADYTYTEIALGNSSDVITLSCSDETIIDQVEYGFDFLSVPGYSLSLKPDNLTATDNDNADNWCVTEGTFGDGDHGTPGLVNDPCAEGLTFIAFALGNVSGQEGDVGLTAFDFTVNRTGDLSQASSVDFIVSGSGTAQASASDFENSAFPFGMITFAPNEDTKTLAINVNGDLDFEMDEGFNIFLSNSSDGTLISNANANGTILNDDAFTCAAQPGDLVITEIMQNPAAVSDDNGEWFELYNTTDNAINIDGFVISDDGSDNHIISGMVVIPAGGFVVLGNNANMATNGGVAVAYAYNGITLGNGADEIIISCDDGEIDRVDYDGGDAFPDPSGESMTLNPNNFNITDNDFGAFWCRATSTYGTGDSGTPGASNDACANPVVQFTIEATPDSDMEEGNDALTEFSFRVLDQEQLLYLQVSIMRYQEVERTLLMQLILQVLFLQVL